MYYSHPQLVVVNTKEEQMLHEKNMIYSLHMDIDRNKYRMVYDEKY